MRCNLRQPPFAAYGEVRLDGGRTGLRRGVTQQECRWKPTHLFADWKNVFRRLQSAKHVALFLDFDGTLAALNAQPFEVELDDEMRSVLRRLAGHPRYSVCIISGRQLGDLRGRVRLRKVRCLGVHGMDDGRGTAIAPGSRLALRQAMDLADQRLGAIPGVWIEDKKIAFAVHFRAADRAGRALVTARLRLLQAILPDGLRFMRGKKVWEVLPAEARGKGSAAARVLQGLPKGSLPVYVGDDTTDECAFSTLRFGLTVAVGRRRTAASHFVASPAEVRAFLERLDTP